MYSIAVVVKCGFISEFDPSQLDVSLALYYLRMGGWGQYKTKYPSHDVEQLEENKAHVHCCNF